MVAVHQAVWTIRVASNRMAGGGHVARCLVLARELARDVSVSLRLDPDGDRWLETVRSEGFEAELDDPRERGRIDGCVLDGYRFSDEELARWRSRAGCLAVVVDAGTPTELADVALCPWVAAPPVGFSGLALCGIEHALVDSRFRQVGPAEVPPISRHVFVSFGRIDRYDVTGRVVAALCRLSDRGWRPTVTIALDSTSPHCAAVASRAAALGADILLDAADIVPPLAACDLAIGAGGVGALERAAAGRPSIAIAQTAEQGPLLQTLSGANATRWLGFAGELSDDALDAGLLSAANDAADRASMARSGRLSVDCLGARRVAAALLCRRAA